MAGFVKFITVDGKIVYINPDQVAMVIEHEGIDSLIVAAGMGEGPVVPGLPGATVHKLAPLLDRIAPLDLPAS